MASRRRAQEEKNLKILRELVALPSNKQCFDCLQRGPTYVNVTIGSFVCTSCSGVLRGLTPPHRVKSITMTTFTPEEIEFIKNRGNEYCQYVWLGTYDSRTNLDSETRDEQRIREFMIQKYERKRWYVDPEIAIKKLQQDQQNSQLSNISTKKNTLPETKPLTTLLGKNIAPLVIHNNQGQSNSPWSTSVTSASQLCSSTSVSSQAQGDQTANGNFANFENAFTNPVLSPSSSQSHHQRKAYTPPAGWTSFDDDLDPLFSTAPPSSQRHSSHNVPPRLDAHSQSQSCSSSTVMPRPLSLPTFTPTNPFTSPLLNPPEVSTPSFGSDFSSAVIFHQVFHQWPSFPASSSATFSPSASTVSNSTTFRSEIQPFKTDFAMPSVVTSLERSQHQQQQNSSQPSVPVSAPPAADRYAALADLDSLFHHTTEVSTTAPSWTLSTSSSSIFGSPTSSVPTSFGTVSSNPFNSTSISWSQSTTTQSCDSVSCANPFQTSVQLTNHNSQSTSTSTFGQYEASSTSNVNSENRFGCISSSSNTIPFSPYTSEGIGSPLNGAPSNQLGVQNGGFGISQSQSWRLTSGTSLWPTGQQNQVSSYPATKLNATATQFNAWQQSTANPFLSKQTHCLESTTAVPFNQGGNGCAGVPTPRLNPSNPFL